MRLQPPRQPLAEAHRVGHRRGIDRQPEAGAGFLIGERLGLRHPFDEEFGEFGSEQRLELHLVGGGELVEQFDQCIVKRLLGRREPGRGERGDRLGGDLQNAVGNALIGIQNRDRGAIAREQFGEPFDALVRLGLGARFAGEEFAHHRQIFVDVIGIAGDRHAFGRADDVVSELRPLLAGFDRIAARHSDIDQLGLAAPAERVLVIDLVPVGIGDLGHGAGIGCRIIERVSGNADRQRQIDQRRGVGVEQRVELGLLAHQRNEEPVRNLAIDVVPSVRRKIGIDQHLAVPVVGAVLRPPEQIGQRVATLEEEPDVGLDIGIEHHLLEIDHRMRQPVGQPLLPVERGGERSAGARHLIVGELVPRTDAIAHQQARQVEGLDDVECLDAGIALDRLAQQGDGLFQIGEHRRCGSRGADQKPRLSHIGDDHPGRVLGRQERLLDALQGPAGGVDPGCTAAPGRQSFARCVPFVPRMTHRIARKREGKSVETLLAAHPQQPDGAGLEKEILAHCGGFALALSRGIAAVIFCSAHHAAKRGLQSLHRVDCRCTPKKRLIFLGGELDRQIGLRAGDLRHPLECALCWRQRHRLMSADGARGAAVHRSSPAP